VTYAGDEFNFHTPTFDDNTLCFSCHAGYGPYSGLTREQAAVSFLLAGGEVDMNGTPMVLGDYTSEETTEALLAVAAAVGEHMQDEVNMGAAAYNPLNEAMPVGRCASCHMPKTAKSGGWTTGVDAAGDSALVAGDQGSHVFDIVWPYESSILLGSAGGSDTNIMPNSCGGCHEGSRLSAD